MEQILIPKSKKWNLLNFEIYLISQMWLDMIRTRVKQQMIIQW